MTEPPAQPSDPSGAAGAARFGPSEDGPSANPAVSELPAGLVVAGPGRLAVDVEIEADLETVFAAATDWPAQARWIPLTGVRVARGDGRTPGSVVHAFTGVGKIGFLDVFHVVDWEPPHRVEVVHVGRVVRGPGAFRLTERGPGRTVMTWSEDLHLPFGAFGVRVWPLVRPLAAAALGLGLRRFRRYVAERAR
ncbi:SRPBCC family protein [Cryptosporangium aurantiacum]|uniref:Polyketide cyclase / dehydrase and lipid transport n=1 Tax=Cryptosporangium aurantiacum TaxID=134849 RepID=A0A1M7QQ09_9ACTN|nr:SRPBCC family protein [Cryptosporangium aurantiacum]SHN33618.1 Polyketide cyclase / dehydrase and lipid transport [Cryptosporangium aurantiacum]